MPRIKFKMLLLKALIEFLLYLSLVLIFLFSFDSLLRSIPILVI